MMSALSDVLPEFGGFLAFFGLVFLLAWVFDRCWGRSRPLPRREGVGRAPTVAVRGLGLPPRPTPGLSHEQWRDRQMRMRGGYTGTRLPDPPYPAPKRVMPPNAITIEDAVQDYLRRNGIV